MMWLKSFLYGRFQRVILNRIQSQWSEVTSGVPQGSVATWATAFCVVH